MNRRTLLSAFLAAPIASLTRLPRLEPVPAGTPVAIGSYVDLAGLTPAAARAYRTRQLGRPDRIYSIYYAWTDPLPDSFDGGPAGAVPLLSWSGTRYDDILSGGADAMIAADARALTAYGRPVYLRFAWEMNGFWFDWGGPNNRSGAAGFVRAWRHVHDIFTAAGAANVTWVWCVNWNNNPDTATNAAHLYYPGDDYVDWIGVDGFSDSGETPDQLFGAFYRGYAGRKPLMIAETAVTEPDRGRPGATVEAAWIDGFAGWIRRHPDIRALVWFDTDVRTETGGQVNWRVDAYPGELDAYRRLITDPYFGGSLP